jgi:putative tricarboxylic transport membrane protein
MRRAEILLALAVLALAAALAREGWSLRYYTPLGPGPGFFPVWLAGLLGGLALVVMVQARRSTSTLPTGFLPPPGTAVRIAAVVAGLVGCFLAIDTLGFATTLCGFLLLVLRVCGPVAWPMAFTLAAIGGLGVTLVFRSVLRVGLPVGPLGF